MALCDRKAAVRSTRQWQHLCVTLPTRSYPVFPPRQFVFGMCTRCLYILGGECETDISSTSSCQRMCRRRAGAGHGGQGHGEEGPREPTSRCELSLLLCRHTAFLHPVKPGEPRVHLWQGKEKAATVASAIIPNQKRCVLRGEGSTVVCAVLQGHR